MNAPPRVMAVGLVILGLALAAMGFYVASADDAPGAAAIGMLLMLGAVALGVKAARRRLPARVGRAALAAGVVVTAVAAFLTREVALTRPLFAAPRAVPSVAGQAPAPPFAPAVERARQAVREEVSRQRLPGVSVAVGVGGAIVWTEGFGWRDVATEAPVTPATRFAIGTAAAGLAPAAASLALADTGAEPAERWSPDHVGEPEEDFPLFTVLRHVVFQPLGLAPRAPLPGDRATFYVPRSEASPARGRRLMAMRALACCAAGRTSYSTPSDVVRAAFATRMDHADGALAGGMVLSLVARPDRGLAVAVASNIAHANTRTIAARVLAAFDGGTP